MKNNTTRRAATIRVNDRTAIRISARPGFAARLTVAIVVALLVGLAMGKFGASIDAAQWFEDHLVLGHQLCETFEDGAADCGAIIVRSDGRVVLR